MHKFVFTGYIFTNAAKLKSCFLDNPIKQPYVTEQKKLGNRLVTLLKI